MVKLSLPNSCMQLLLCLTSLMATTLAYSLDPDIPGLINQAEYQKRLGIADQGADRSFLEAQQLLDLARKGLAAASFPTDRQQQLQREIDDLGADMEVLTETYRKRFYGVLPLARLLTTSAHADEGFALTEQLYHPADVAAMVSATNSLVKWLLQSQLRREVVINSVPADRELENVVAEVLQRSGSVTLHPRHALIDVLSEADMAAFDRDDLNPELANDILQKLDIVGLMVLTIERPAELADASVRALQSDYYILERVLTGNRSKLGSARRTQSSMYVGYARDRREQRATGAMVQLLLLGIAVFWATQIRWNLGKPLPWYYRALVGVVLFAFGRFFLFIVNAVLKRYAPEATAILFSALWWPALLGLMAILGGGLLAWIGQALLTNVVPGARGARAVGSIFALVAIGACSSFVMPLLLLDKSAGLASLLPFTLTSVILATLFGFAARTGPPVPKYFTLGPALVAPLAGVALLRADSTILWLVACIGLTLCLIAWLRHRIAVARGTEQSELSADEAVRTDSEKLIKLGEELGRKL